MSYAFSPRSACMHIYAHGHGMQNNHVIPLSHGSWISRSTMPLQPRPTTQKDALELFGSGCTLSDVHKRLAGKAQRAQSLRALMGRDPFPKRLQAGDY